MPGKKERILIVEDEAKYIRVMRVVLGGKGYEIMTAGDGRTAVEMVASDPPDLVILDIRMPEMNGFEACRRIREFSTVPIIMVTAMADDLDKIKGLEAGADDYLTKPFNANELVARVQSALRRVSYSKSRDEKPCFQVGELSIDFNQKRVHVGGEEVELSPIEYHLLGELIRNAGRVLVTEHLLDAVWGVGYEGETRLVWRAVHRLRQKIEADPSHPCYIKSHPGIGYVFERRNQERDS